MYFIFFDNVGGGKVLEDFRKVIQFKKNKNGNFSFCC